MSHQDKVELTGLNVIKDPTRPDLEAGESLEGDGLRHRGSVSSKTAGSPGSVNHAVGGGGRHAELLTLESYKTSFWAVLKLRTNIGLIFVPLAFVFEFVFPNKVVLLAIMNFLAITPLTSLLVFASDQFALHVGGFFAEIIYEFQKNLVEIIFAV
ncbi:unnamed protein product [Rhizoctonia solani]|uniref:Uncharacterized protein n=1 Tax=Rhizoctonia solani TaxID=456999 RepID=A0A8H3GC33_9AGAM|nr:unnamed protein product [Rhizoctonia solani]